MYKKDTIYGLATPLGRSGVAVIRISGAQAFDVFERLGVAKLPPERTAFIAKIYDRDQNQQLDECLLFKFSNPHSFTGEDVVELHLHGSISVINDTLSYLSTIPDFRISEPGEFSKRAFYNNKLDLTEAEGLAMLIDSETARQREVALGQLCGSLSNVYEGWRELIITIMAKVEALIDFPEDDIPSEVLDELGADIVELSDQVQRHIATASKGISIMEGIKIPILGPPNAGKSSLLNVIADEEIAIISDIAGTTRDVISVKVNLGGYCVILKDTAGIRDTQDAIEKIGVARALAEMQQADIALILMEQGNIDESLLEMIDEHSMLVINKIDDGNVDEQLRLRLLKYNPFYISTNQRSNIDELIWAITQKVIDTYRCESGGVITKLRYREKLAACLERLESIDLKSHSILELAAEDLRQAISYLEEITGRIDIEDVLDKIFSTFCIGK